MKALHKLKTALACAAAAIAIPVLFGGTPPDYATGEAIGITADVMVIDVSGGAEADEYPVSVFRDVDVGSFNCETCKTSRIVLRWIPKGEYPAKIGYSGSDDLQSSDRLRTAGFWIGLFEFTGGQTTNVINQRSVALCRPQGRIHYLDLRGESCPTNSVGNSGDLPLIKRICDRAKFNGQLVGGFDLPTEGQWEIAARAGSVKAYGEYWNTNTRERVAITISPAPGNLSTVAWYEQNNYKVLDVGSLLPNCFGLYDTLGNVREQCRDAFVSGSWSADADVPYFADTDNRVNRGGMYSDSSGLCLPSTRPISVKGYDTGAGDGEGFRLACTTAIPLPQPAVRVISAANRYPWSGKVDCVYVVSNVLGRTNFRAAFTVSADKHTVNNSKLSTLECVLNSGYPVSRTVTNAFAAADGLCTNALDIAGYFAEGVFWNGVISAALVDPADASVSIASPTTADFITDTHSVKQAKLTDGHRFIVGEEITNFSNGQLWTPWTDGTIYVDSTTAPGDNATFRITLPREEHLGGWWRAADVTATNRYEAVIMAQSRIPDPEEFARKGITTDYYHSMFKATCRRDNGNGTFEVGLDLTNGVAAAATAFMNSKLSGEITTAMQTVRARGRLVTFELEGGVPGLYYSVQGVTNLSHTAEIDWLRHEWRRDLCGSDGKVKVTVPYLGKESAYYRLKAFYTRDDYEVYGLTGDQWDEWEDFRSGE